MARVCSTVAGDPRAPPGETCPDERVTATLLGLTYGPGVCSRLDRDPIIVDLSFLERYWYGRAHVFSRDFEGLGPGLLGDDVKGVRIMRLQSLLTRTGLYDAGETGTYGPATRAAVMAFQRSRFIDPDGQVGRLTRMVLYAAVGGYDRPTLAADRRENVVSSILDALRADRGTGGPQPSGGGPPDGGRRRRWRVILFFVAAIVVGAAPRRLFLRPATPGVRPRPPSRRPCASRRSRSDPRCRHRSRRRRPP
jgi:hypothetical protein